MRRIPFEAPARLAPASILTAGLVIAAAGCASGPPPPLDPLTADTGGALSANERATDVVRYELTLEVFPDEESIRGEGVTVLRALEPLETVELQLDARFSVPEVRLDGRTAAFERRGGILEVSLPEPVASDVEVAIAVPYEGRPHVAEAPPWKGGFVWGRTDDDQPWIATAVQGEGCDLWWPCKDHFADKPERMELRVTVPAGLSAVLNGVLKSVDEEPDGRRTFHWTMDVPITAYNVSLNVGPFERIETSYEAVNGATVPIEFWVLPEHEEDARRLIDEDLRAQLAWFESRLGPYPWGDVKLGFVETPHLGMEHQTLNAYGNRFERDDHGFDWLLQHELAHEWFGNLMTHERLNDAWLHESFGAYMQAAYSLDRDGEAAHLHRMYERYLGMENCEPIVQVGDPTSAEAFTGDIYAKGSWVLHTLRWLIGDEPFWRATRRLLYDTAEPWSLPYPIRPRYRNTDELVRLASEEAGRDLGWFFDVYLREADLPTLESERTADRLVLRWRTPGDRPFPMPIPVRVDGETIVVEMRDGEGSVPADAGAHVIIDPEMYVLRRLPIIGTCEEIEAEREEEEKQSSEEKAYD
jgi:aminopeptidase N